MNRRKSPILLWVALAGIVFCMLPLALSVNESGADGSPLHYVKLRAAASTTNDTLFGVDSLTVDVHFQANMDLDWVHYVAPVFSGGDSAGLESGILVFYSNDGTNFYAATVAAHDTIFAGATAATDSSSYLSGIPLLRAIRLRFVSTADNDSTIISGFYIYR